MELENATGITRVDIQNQLAVLYYNSDMKQSLTLGNLPEVRERA